MRQLKKILGNNAHWTINKELAKDIGLDATILLQHFIDLQYSFFEDGGFYQQQHRLVEDLPLTIDYLRKATKVLIDKGFITVVKRGVPAKNHYTVHEDKILQYLSDITSDTSEGRLDVSQKDDLTSTRKTTNTKNKDTKNKDTNTESDKSDSDAKRLTRIKNLYWKKLVPAYPTNRLGNRQDGLKKWLKLEDVEMVLAIKNLDRYLELADGFVNRLDNYIERRCFTEEWLKAQAKTKQKKNHTTAKLNPNHNFSGDYGDIVETDLEWDF